MFFLIHSMIPLQLFLITCVCAFTSGTLLSCFLHQVSVLQVFSGSDEEKRWILSVKCGKFISEDAYFVTTVKHWKYVFEFCLCGQPEFVNVCFWFIPPSLRGKEGNADYQKKMANVSFCVPLVKLWLNIEASAFKISDSFFYISHIFIWLNAAYLLKEDILFWIIQIKYVLPIGSSNNQGAYDETRHPDGRLPASWRHGQLFPRDCLFPTCFTQRHGLLPWWNSTTWKWSVTNWS